jgi:hypothetical protein
VFIGLKGSGKTWSLVSSSGGSDGQTFPFGLHWFGRFDFYEPTPNQNQKMQTKLSLFQTGVQTKLTEFHTDI